MLVFFEGTRLSDAFTERGPTPYAIALLFFWAIAILFVKCKRPF
jgi:hypothetical protein